MSAQVKITEFMAANSKTLKDDFGEYSDWIEVFNAGSAAVNLQDWGLTDSAGQPFKWRFPGTNLPPKSFLVVYASNRDRRLPGQPLHTNFKLDAAGEYLALVHPDGTAAAEFAPAYDPQFDDVSYGYGVSNEGRLLIGTKATGRVLVPESGIQGTLWLAPVFDDSAWLPATNGVGFKAGLNDDPGALSAYVLADHPAAYWRFEQTNETSTLNSGWQAAAANGQLLGGVIPGVPGPGTPDFGGFEAGNRAIRLNGTGARVEVPFMPDLNPGGSFTVEAWAKPARSGGAPGWIFSSLDVANGRSGYAIAQDYSAKNQWEFRLGDGQGYIAMAYGGTVDTNHWQYLAGVFDGTAARLYVNGALAASASLARPFAANTAQKTLIGGRIDAANPYYYAGDVDEVSVISRALTGQEIATRYQRALKTSGQASGPTYENLVSTDLSAGMAGRSAAVYLRLPFTVTNAAPGDRLILRMKYDDGFAAFLNGNLVASANAPAELVWNSTATARHSAEAAVQFEEFDLSDKISYLQEGSNVLAIQGLNLAATNSDFLLLVELEHASQAGFFGQTRYFLQPSPGSLNGAGAKDLGPILSLAGHLPRVPGTNDSITVTCRVAQAFAPVSQVKLHWRTMFNTLREDPMFDDGQHGDGAADDGVFGASIPNREGNAWTYSAGQMVRWYVTAVDSLSRTSRWPLFENPAGSAEFLGTVIQPDSVTSKLPVFHLFAPASVLQPGPVTQQIGADSEQGGRVSLYHDGDFYDNIYMELRGNTSAGLNKKAHRLEFNDAQPFRHPGSGLLSRKSSLLAEDLDPAYLRQHLCFWLLEKQGVPAPFDYPVRLQLNGAFYQLAFHNEVLGAEQLDRLGYAASGALYKCAGQVNPQFSSTGGFQKLLPKTNLTARVDYLKLANGINETKTEAVRRAAVFDLLDVPEVVNYLAGARFCAENDDVWANMCLYCDTYGDGLWRVVPYDMNASWGQLYGGSSPLQATVDNSKSHPLYGGSQVQEGGNSAWNRIYDVIIALPETRAMLLRRERSLLDRWVLPPGTAPESLILENYIKQMTNLISAEAALDRQKWGYSPWAPGKTFANGISDLLTQFVGPRRTHWYKTHSITNTTKPIGLGNNFNAGIPLTQPVQPALSFVAWDLNPVSGNQEEEFLCLTNANAFAVDVSGWRLDGAIRHTLQPGTVLPPGGALYLSPNAVAFRARTTGPRGGQGLFVQGGYQGHLSAWGESLALSDETGLLIVNTNLPGLPTLAQRCLRITEIMYHPAPSPGATNDSRRFEYIEFRNISTNETLDLAGIRLEGGVAFNFTAGAIKKLLPGQMLLVVSDTNSFAQRYGGGLNVAGQFAGTLENAGEKLRLWDASGEKILEFAYDPKWQPLTDGPGYSLVVVDELAPPSAWDLKTNWRPSSHPQGSPGVVDPAPPGSHDPFLAGIARNGSTVEISVASRPGFYYVLEYKTDLREAAWLPLHPPVPGTGEILVLTDVTAPGSCRFYRIRAE